MIPFLSQLDLILASGVVTGLVGLGGSVYLLARHQRPATRPVLLAEAEERATASETASSVAAA